MPAEQTRWALRRIDRLFQDGCVTGLDDARLLERFASDRDESTLEALIERHGPMVLGVCRRLLANPADVEDAFQATFLILVRKAPALRDVHRLGPWLHGVAYRVAARARTDAYRRRLREQQGARPDREPETHSPDRLAAQAELREAVDREIARLSASHRAAIVLCDLEGRSSQDAARLLGWSEDALRGRLARARQKLRQRLERRNLAPILLPGTPEILSLPAPLIETTTRASMATVLAGRAAPSAVGVISASVSTLAHGVIQTMFLSRMKRLTAGLILSAIGLLAATGLVRAGLPGAQPAAATSRKPQPEGQAPEAGARKPLPGPIQLRVIARQGKQPVAGAMVEASTIFEGSYRENKFTTDAQGRCTISLPGGGPLAMLSIAKDGFVPFYRAWGDQDPAPAKSINQELEPGQPIGGFVRDEQGQPIVAADVTVAIGTGHGEIPDVDVPAPGNIQVYAGYPHLQVKTDAQGRWQCSILPAKPDPATRLWFFLEHPDHVSDTGGYSRRLSLATARAMTGSLIMSEGVEVRGDVRDGANRPATGARVVLAYSANSGNLLSTRTDDQGRFRFAHANDKNGLRRWVVSVQAAGFAPAWQPVALTAPIPPVSLRVTPSKPFHGRVVDAKGKPIAGSSVSVSWQECQHLDWKGFTDADGRFVWSDGPLDGEIVFSAGKQGYVSVYHHRIAAEAGETTITLNPPMRVHGTVVDAETGQPIPGFQLVEGESSHGNPISWRWTQRSGRAFTGGRFDASPFQVEYPGTIYYLRAEADGYVPATSRGITFGEPEITLAFRLKKGFGPSGFVRTPDGKPAVGADVYLTNPKYGLPLHNNVHEPPPAREFWTRTDDKGHFSFGARDEPYGVLVVHFQGVAQKTPEDLALSSGMTLEPYGRIEGTLRIGNELGKRRPIHVRLERSAHPSDPWLCIQYSAMTDDQGHFKIDRVMPGEAAVSRRSSVNGIEVDLKLGPADRRRRRTGRPRRDRRPRPARHRPRVLARELGNPDQPRPGDRDPDR